MRSVIWGCALVLMVSGCNGRFVRAIHGCRDDVLACGDCASATAENTIGANSGGTNTGVNCSRPCSPEPVCRPEVELRTPAEIHVKAPPQRILVKQPSAAVPHPEPAPAGLAAPGPSFAAPTPAIPLQTISYANPMPVAFAAAPQPISVVSSTVQTISPPRARMALGLGYIRLPIPYPRLFALPGEQEIVTRQTQQMMPAVASPPAFAPAPTVMAMTPNYIAVPGQNVPVATAQLAAHWGSPNMPMATVPGVAAPVPLPPMYAPAAVPAPAGIAITTVQRTTAPAACPCPPQVAAPATSACGPGLTEDYECLKRRLESLGRLMQERGVSNAPERAPNPPTSVP